MSETPAFYLTDRPEETGDIDNLDEDFPVPSFEGPDGEIQPAIIQDEMAAERHLKAISYYQHEAKYVHDHAAAHRARIDAWEQARLRPMLGRIVWHEGGLRAFLARSGKKALKLAYGSFRWVSGRESVEIVDDVIFQGWACLEAEGCIRVKREADKVAIKAWIKEHGGELPPGVDLKVGEPTFKVDVA